MVVVGLLCLLEVDAFLLLANHLIEGVLQVSLRCARKIVRVRCGVSFEKKTKKQNRDAYLVGFSKVPLAAGSVT